MKNIQQLTPKQIRNLTRIGKWDKPTAGLVMGYAQANLVILPQEYAFDFLLFCQRNQKPCPLLEVLEPGKFLTAFLSKDADIRTDIPMYNVYRKGKLERTVRNIRSLWKNDFVTFLLGCSFSFEEALLRSKIPIRHIEENKNVPMFITNIPCKPAGVFHARIWRFHEMHLIYGAGRRVDDHENAGTRATDPDAALGLSPWLDRSRFRGAPGQDGDSLPKGAGVRDAPGDHGLR
ncbi:MAG: DUF1445 domain-containing protein [Syntrophobacteraceae bacterium]|nr:DUF1445 domain-containing protein [Syntrophobacteraceae bacterium]